MLLSSAASESVDLVSLDTGSMGPELYVNQFFCLEILFFCCFSIFTRDVKVACSDFFLLMCFHFVLLVHNGGKLHWDLLC